MDDGEVGIQPFVRDRARERLGVGDAAHARALIRCLAGFQVVEEDAADAAMFPSRGNVKVFIAPLLARLVHPVFARRAVVRIAHRLVLVVKLARVVLEQIIRRQIRAAAVPRLTADSKPAHVRAKRRHHGRPRMKH